MRPAIAKLWLPLTLVVAAAWIAFRHAALGDYPVDAEPAVTALTHGKVAVYLESHPMMGPVSTLFEAPFSMLGHSSISSYEWVCLGCLLPVVAVACYLAKVARRRGAGPLVGPLVAILFVVNPITFEAIWAGHPEELFTAALAIFAVAMAIEGRDLPAAVFLGLAIAAKQWAALAILPVLMALPSRRLRTALIAAAIVAILTLPSLLFAPGAFMDVQTHAASRGDFASVWSVWFPFSPTTHVVGESGTVITANEMPAAIRPVSQLLVVGLIFGIPAAYWAKRRGARLDASEVLALLSLITLVRCAFDPVDNLYYHVPFILSLLAWDAFEAKRLPLRGLLAAAVSLLFWEWNGGIENLTVFNTVYLAVVLAAGMAIAGTLLRREAREPTGRPVPTATAALG